MSPRENQRCSFRFSASTRDVAGVSQKVWAEALHFAAKGSKRITSAQGTGSNRASESRRCATQQEPWESFTQFQS